jgi:hypothetical protein
MQDDTPRSRRHYTHDKHRQVMQHGGDELTPRPENKSQVENRERMGVNGEHKTRTMQKRRRGTYP